MTKGKETKSANGHPTIAPIAKKNVPSKVLCPLLLVGSRNAYENAIMLAYMANEEGKKADGPKSSI